MVILVFNLTVAEKNKKLKSALADGKYADVTKWLKSGADPKSIVESGEPFIWIFTNYGPSRAKKTIEAFLAAGVSPNNLTEKAKTTPLIAAIDDNAFDIAQLLINSKADLNATNEFGRTAFHTAVMKRNALSIVNALISRGGITGGTDYKGYTPLLHAISNGYKIDILKKALIATENVNAFPKDNGTAVHMALREHNEELFNLLMEDKRVDLKAKNNDCRGALSFNLLYYAVEYEYNAALVPFLQMGFDMNQSTPSGMTAFLLAAQKSKFVPAKRMVDYAKEKNIPLPYFQAFKLALGKGETNTLSLYLPELTKEELDTKDDEGMTFLMHAVANSHDSVVRRLITAGADPHIIDTVGRTAYSIAFEQGNEKLIKYLEKYRQPNEPSYEPPPPPPEPLRDDGQRYNKISDYVLEVSNDKNDLVSSFNFWTQQVTHKDKRSGGGIVVQNFDDVQREEAILEAFRRLTQLDGKPPAVAPRGQNFGTKKIERKQQGNKP